MSLDIVSVGPLYLGPDMNKIRLLTTDAARKLAFPPKSFIPSKTKLTTIETKRIMSVLDEAIRKVELVTLLSDVIANKEALEKMLGEDIMRAVREHEDLCKTLQDHISELSDQEKQVQQLEDMEDERDLRDLQFLMQEEKYSLPPLMRQIKDATKNILRLLLSNPQATRFLEMQKLSRSTQAQTFINSLVELRGFLFEKLLTSPMEVREKTQYIQSISRQNKRNQETIATLEHELAKSLKNRDAEVEKENFVIQELKNHLHQVLKFSENSLLRTKQEAEKQQKADFRASQARMAKIQQEILKLRTRYHSLVTENREQEQALRKKKYKVETEIENWIQKYDAEMSEKQTEFEDLEVIHKEEKAQLEELRKKHDVLVEEFSQIRSEREVDSKKRMEAEEQLLRMVRAATLIQAMWKGYLVRSMLKTKRKKWGKGKGKAKGKEGKGKEGKGKGKEKAKGKK